MISLTPVQPLRQATPRAMPLRLRDDLIIQQVGTDSATRWVVKDPISLRYFHFRREEFFVLQRLDGTRSLEDIRREFIREFPAENLTTMRLQTFMAYLHENSLIITDAEGEGQRMLVRRRRARASGARAAMTNLLAIRFPGFDPTRLLDWLSPRCRWMFTRTFVAACLLVIIAAALLLAVQARTFLVRLPDFHAFFTVINLVYLMAAVAGAKVLHELAHALTCRHFGAQCHEMGFMLLVFTPCLYCNVTDSWMLRHRRERILISAAGMFVEVVLAALCVFGWWFSHPGLFNSLCLNQLVVCSVATLLFNGNPLLRYDGYYILSDLVNVPNLQQRATEALRAVLAKFFLGVKLPRTEFGQRSHTGWLAAYAIASMLYKLFILAAILWFYYKLLEPYQLQVFPQILGGLTIATAFLLPLWRSMRFFGGLASGGHVHWFRFLFRTIVVAAILGVIIFVPLPRTVSAPAVLESQDARRVYVTVPGELKSIVAEGTVVRQEDVLAELESPLLRRDVAESQGLLNQEQRHLDNLRKRRIQEPDVELQIPAVIERIKDLQDQLQQRLTDLQALSIIAPRNGTVIAVPNDQSQAAEGELMAWSGSLHDAKNRGCFLESGTQLCLIGDPDQGEAMLLIDRNDIPLVQPGQSVKLYFGALQNHLMTGKIVEVAEADTDVLPPMLAKQVQIPVRDQTDNGARPMETVYLARVKFEDQPQRIISGSSGAARIRVAPRSLALRLADYVTRTFRMEF
ncbi:HlyD family secretion protein [Symmachiella dynata]|uniref:HlyD family secretion protein n=1 Tax=Symmachiella dynata TaxID=2527995 RepID=A0A517ZQU2_9PLAN|nr:hypothetical protein [Symmachiella dynata]QDU44861.1 HlyD family secretion protein [Symmachiella dynata]